METFSALLALCAGNSPVTGRFPAQRPVTRNFDIISDLRLDKRLRKQSWAWWFETPSRSLWRHSNVLLQWNISPNPKLISNLSKSRPQFSFQFSNRFDFLSAMFKFWNDWAIEIFWQTVLKRNRGLICLEGITYIANSPLGTLNK